MKKIRGAFAKMARRGWKKSKVNRVMLNNRKNI